jgi:ABC-type sugar transport system permease subunit
MYLVQTMRAYHQWGYAATIALVLFLLIVVVSMVNFLLVRRIRGQE